MILAAAVLVTQTAIAGPLGPNPAVFESKKYGIRVSYPRTWKVVVTRAMASDPAGQFLDNKPSHKDLLVFRVDDGREPWSTFQLRLSDGARSGFKAFVDGHPNRFKQPLPLESAGSKWGEEDATFLGAQKAIAIYTTALTFNPKYPVMDTLQLDSQDPDRRMWRVLASCQYVYYKPGPGNVERTKYSQDQADLILHKRMLEFRAILKSITFQKVSKQQ